MTTRTEGQFPDLLQFSGGCHLWKIERLTFHVSFQGIGGCDFSCRSRVEAVELLTC